MESSLYLFRFKRLLFLFSCFHLMSRTRSSSSIQSQCHEDESSALLQFKHSFVIKKFASSNPSAYPKVESWKLEGGDCCSWHGVKCDKITGHVTGLDLSSSLLYGSINSSSSLFSLVQLQGLNLADNHFNYSEIPSGIGHLSMLTSLNLSSSSFLGQIPSEISGLSNLASLDLSYNSDSFFSHGLKSLVQYFTKLKELYLTKVNLFSSVPDILANFSSLTGLALEGCGLYGEFPRGILLLPKLQHLSVRNNMNLTGHLPEFNHSSPLMVLSLGNTSFSGNLPDSIGNLESLNYLDFSQCNFSGTLPASLGNLTKLTVLDLSNNNFSGQLPSSLAKLSQLTSLSIGHNDFSGQIPTSLSNLTQLSYLDFSVNQLVDQIPSWLANLTRLAHLDLAENQLRGPILRSFYQLKRLKYLDLSLNNLNGTVELDIFLELQNLSTLQLNSNQLTVLTKNNTNATFLPKFNIVGLRACNLKEFPGFLQFQDELFVLNLADNEIGGQIPTRVWNSSKETMTVFAVSHNILTGFDQNPAIIPWRFLRVLVLSSNRLQGSLPIPPKSTQFYNVADNMLTGEISPSICNNSFLAAVDLSNNNFSGTIPHCLATITGSLLLLNLSGNSFQGTIPEMFTTGSELKMIDLSQNQLQGQVPRTLANCTKLQILILGNNLIEDNFPIWLGALPELQVLVLRHNKFHGSIESPNTDPEFLKLRIIDLSHNRFSGNLPSKYFQKWKAMKMVYESFAYMQLFTSFELSTHSSQSIMENVYSYSITITNKGTQRVYEKIQSAFVAIDLSSNEFGGDIPESMGNFKGLQLLNLSNNELIGRIPSSLGNLTNMESLDLSQNMLSGKIPQQLTQLTFLAVFDVSRNHLTGPIPRGAQFDTFQNNSFEENSGLRGVPLSKKCGNSEASLPPPSTFQEDKDSDSDFPSKIDWIVITLGYGSGLTVGLLIGYGLTTRKHEWFVNTFGRRQQRRRKNKRGQRVSSGEGIIGEPVWNLGEGRERKRKQLSFSFSMFDST